MRKENIKRIKELMETLRQGKKPAISKKEEPMAEIEVAKEAPKRKKKVVKNDED